MTNAPDLIPVVARALWRQAAQLILFVLQRYDRARIRTGIGRTSGAHLSMLLTGAESALRRLIFIAALALSPASLKPIEPHAARTSRTASAPARSFRIFSLHGSSAPRRISTRHTPRTPTPYGHIRFPSDPILALGRMPSRRPTHRHNGGPLLPRPARRHPLDRWGRLSRNDPDWRPPIAPDYRIIRPPSPRKPRDENAPPRAPLDSRADWRRHHDEWQKLVPAPVLAARLDALERAYSDPSRLILRTARRLQSHRARTLSLARAAWPNTDAPRRARHLQVDTWERDVCDAVHHALDTS